MLLIKYIIENLRFVYRWIHPNFKLIKVDFNQIHSWDRLTTAEKRKMYFPFEKPYEWQKLKNSLNKIGYIPSIVVNLYLTKPDYSYTIKDGHHRFFILSANAKPKDKIKVWVHKKNSKKVKKFVDGDTLIKSSVENSFKKLNEQHLKRVKRSPNYERLKKEK